MDCERLTDGSFVSSWVVYFIISDSLGSIHGFIEHHKLHLLLLDHFLLHASVHILIILRLIHLTVIKIVAHTHSLILLLDHSSTSIILEVTLLLVGFDSNVSIDAVEVLLLLREHLTLCLV